MAVGTEPSGIRRVIDNFSMGKKLRPHFIRGLSQAWMVPSATELGKYYVVNQFVGSSGKVVYLCNCKGYRFSTKTVDQCWHVKKVKEEG